MLCPRNNPFKSPQLSVKSPKVKCTTAGAAIISAVVSVQHFSPNAIATRLMPTAQRTAVQGRQTNNWNSFQRENKGRWDREELSRQWILYKQQLSDGQDVAADTAAAPSSRAKDSDFSALKAGIRALLHKTSARDAAPATQSREVDDAAPGQADEAAPGQANTNIQGCGSQLCIQVPSTSQIVQAEVCCSSGSGSPQTPAARQGPRCLPYIAATAPRCPARATVAEDISRSSRTPQRFDVESDRQVGVPDAACHVVASDAAATEGRVNTCSSSSSSPRVLCDAAPSTAASTAASTPSAVQQGARQQETAACLDGELEASPVSSLGLSRLSEAHAQDLAQLREAVCSLLAKQGPRHAVQEQEPPLQQQRTPHQQHQQSPNQAPSQPAAAGVGTGCFGRGWASSRLSWNAFQKACKGRGLTKPEISAAYAAAKQHYQQTGDILDVDSYLQQQQQHTTQEPLQQPAQQQLLPTGKFATLHYWLRSRTTSRVSSRAGSTAVSPSSSPAGTTRQQQQQQHHHRQQQQEGARQPGVGHSSSGPGGLWGDLKEWLHSRSSSRAASRLGTPAANPGDRCPLHKSCQQQQHQHLPQQQQQDQQDPKAGVEAYMPFAEQLQEPLPRPGPAHQQEEEQQQQVGEGLTRQLPQQEYQQHLQQSSTGAPAAAPPACPPMSPPDPGSADPAQATVGRHTLCPHVACASSNSRLPGLNHGGAAADNRASLEVTPPPAAHPTGSRSAGAPGLAAATAELAADQGVNTTHAGHSSRPDHQQQQQQQRQYVRVGARLARESVPDDLPGVLEGFSQWMPADPQQLKRLKRAVLAKPGLYEVGANRPLHWGAQ